MRKSVVLALCLAGLALALPAAASAFTAPELFFRPYDDQSGPWQPLSGAVMRAPGRYVLGMRWQPTGKDNGGRQVVFVQLVSVPDSKPNQQNGITQGAYCSGGPGTEGSILSLNREVEWEGDGAYSIRAAVYDVSALRGNGLPCAGAGAESTVAFSMDTRPTLQLVGKARIDATDPGKIPSLRAVAGVLAPELRCALNAHLGPDGAPTGPIITPGEYPSLFTAAGAWTCAGRFRGQTTGDVAVIGPWGPPLRVTIHSAVPPFSGLRLRLVRPGLARLSGRLAGVGGQGKEPAEALAAGGVLTFTLVPSRRCAAYERQTGGRPFTRVRRVRVRVRRGGRFNAVLPMPLGTTTARSFAVTARFGGRPLIDAGRVPSFDVLLAMSRAPRVVRSVLTDYCG